MAVDLGKAGSSLRCEGRGVGTEGRRRGGVGCSHRPLAPLACSGCPLKSPHAVFFFFLSDSTGFLPSEYVVGET